VVDDEFEWDDEKELLNLQKHGVTFEEAKAIFKDPLAVTIDDPEHSDDENRFVTIGITFFNDVYVIVHADRENRVRIISARHATRAERRKFMNEQFDRIHDREDKDKDTMRPEYDFTNGVRGKYWKGPGRRIVTHMRIDQDVRRYFRTPDEVNDALRQLIAEGRAPKLRDVE
jgi:uncharacterized DUF497 family protein